MSNAALLKVFGNNDNQEEQKYLYMPSVKTQFAGIEVHKIIIHLFKYLSKKYFSEFEMSDEGQYWETGDEKLLEEGFRRYNALLDSLHTSLEIFPLGKGESFEDYFSRLLKGINERRSKT